MLYRERTYVGGILNGAMKIYYPSKKVKEEGMMKDNYKQGIWKHYDRTGRLAYEEEYQQGTVVKRKDFDE